MFHFIYKGRFDCLISKDTFEMYIQNLYYDIKKRFGVTYNPKKFTIKREGDTVLVIRNGDNNQVVSRTTHTSEIDPRIFTASNGKVNYLIVSADKGHVLVV
jgi:hypothetical protein